jgi:hypothetical protein
VHWRFAISDAPQKPQDRKAFSRRLPLGFGLGPLNVFWRSVSFGGELPFDLESDSIGVHLIDSGGTVKHLKWVGRSTHEAHS